MDIWPLAWAAPALLLVPARTLRARRAFFAGLLFGVLIGVAITHWALYAAHGYFAVRPAIAVALACAAWVWCSGVPYGLLAAAHAWASPRVPRVLIPLLGAWLWVVAEVVRTAQPLAMPWELLAHTQWQNLPLLQVADLGGGFAVSFVVALVSLSAGELLRDAWRREQDRRRTIAFLALPAVLLASALAYGAHALRREGAVAGERRRIAVVQASLSGAAVWQRSRADRNLATYAGLTRQLGPDVDLVVWPENAVEAYVDREPMLGAALSELAADVQADLLLGAPRLDGEHAFNAVFLVPAGAPPAGVYDKRRLVPFAETDPLAFLGIERDGDLAFAAGSAAEPVAAAGLHAGALICWEVLFPGLARESVRRGADVLVNLSNDGWMDPGDATAPRQHLSMAVVRAIETRRALVRAAASGISAFVAPSGEIGNTIGVGARGNLVADVPLRHTITLYVSCGDTWIWVLGIGLVLIVAVARLRGGRPA